MDETEKQVRMILPFLVSQRDKRILETVLHDYQPCVERALAVETRMRLAKANAKKRVAELLEVPPEKRFEAIHRRRRLRTRPVVETLLLLSHRAAHFDPTQSEHFALLAQEVLLEISPDDKTSAGEAGLRDTAALVAAQLANAFRLLCRWEDAQAQLAVAYVHANRGSADPEVLARIQSFHGSLLRERRRYSAALKILRKAEAIHLELDNRDQLALIQLQLASVLCESGSLEQAITMQMSACDGLSERDDPILAAASWVNLARYYCWAERFQEAEAVLEAYESTFDALSADSTAYLDLLWTKGVTARGLGEFNEAVGYFDQAIRGYIRLDDPFSAGLATLDLAIVFHQQGSRQQLQGAVAEAWTLLESQHLHEEARAALSLLVEQGQRRKIAHSALSSVVQLLRLGQPRRRPSGR